MALFRLRPRPVGGVSHILPPTRTTQPPISKSVGEKATRLYSSFDCDASSNALMLPQSSQSPRGVRRSSVGAKPRVCVHCGRGFRRTEHLERHVRTHTKEKPFTCFCGAAFTRRDLLKRHTRIAHEENNPPNTGGLISPNSQPDHEVIEQRNDLQPAENPTIPQRPPYDAPPPGPRANVPIPVSSPAVAQWPGPPQHGTYIPQSQPMMNHDASHAALAAHPAVTTHDAEILEAAQLLLPSGYRAPQPPAQPMPYFPEELNHFQEFTHFLDSIGLPAEWLPTTTDMQPAIHSAVPVDAATRDQPNPSRKAQPDRSRGDSPFRSWLPSVPPGDQSLGSISDYEPPQESRNPSPLKVTEEQRQRLAASLEEFRNVIPDFVLPSRHTLSRYLTSFFEGFHSHLPFMHAPTLRINHHTPELILGICTVGAQYRQEHRNAERLFYTGRAVLLERMAREPHIPLTGYSSITVQIPNLYNTEQGIPPPEAAAGAHAWRQVESIRTLLALMAYASWEPKQELMQEAFSLQSMLVRSLRDFGLAENVTVAPRHSPLLWHEWAEEESIRRTRLISFCFVHIHSIAYNVYPMLRSSEIHLRLPCSTKEWKAATASDWEAAQREAGPQPLFFQEALAILLQPSRTSVVPDPIPTPLGNYILLHGLLQRIHLVSELSLPTGDHASSLPTEELNRLERALRSWTSVWQQAPESSLDPHNENGPIPFTSSALLGMGYVRLSLNLGPYRQLETRDPYRIAAALHRSPRPGRNYRLTPALIYSAHALSIPVRLGIDHVARSQAFFWSVRHSIAGFECAILLGKWLLSLAEPGNGQNLSENESRILHWTRCIVQEAYDSMDMEDNDILPDLEPATLGLAVIKLWSRLFRKNTQWPFINLLGESLKQYLAMIPG